MLRRWTIVAGGRRGRRYLTRRAAVRAAYRWNLRHASQGDATVWRAERARG